ncbi:hypothetical protein [Cohnella yongneupensis]|uniref:Uncharacterized protein n=1 Tax=Cohnella yongneupensis TaxID=425006 RepID=A0ABW0QZB3_9BACL
MHIQKILEEMKRKVHAVNDRTSYVQAVAEAHKAFYTFFNKVANIIPEEQFTLLLDLEDAVNWLRVCEAQAGYEIGYLDALDLFSRE